jgi:long-chain acyl-CoA synthetase
MINEETLPKVFIEQIKKRRDKSFLIHKHEGRWQHVSWNKVGEKVKHLSLGLIALGVQKDDRVAVISETRPELAYSCLAIVNAGAIYSGIYHTNSPKECAYIINNLGAKIVFAEDQGQLDKLEEIRGETPSLQMIITFQKLGRNDAEKIMSLDQLSELGYRELLRNGDGGYYERISTVRPDDVLEIIYTSGTTGTPKGVMESNRGLIRTITEFNKFHPFNKRDIGISFLPMAHALELRQGHWNHIYYGFPQVYAQSVKTAFQDIYETQPTFISSPPRFLEKHYNNFLGIIEDLPHWKKKIVDRGIRNGLRLQTMREPSNKRILYPYYFFRYLIAYLVFFRRVRKTVGKKLRFIITGGAPVPAKIVEFFRAMGFPIYETYGLTESQGLVSISYKGANKIGASGKPADGLEVKIAEDGEILVKGWARCVGYWNNPQATDELFREGWLHTGDIGFLDEEGFLHITDRKKDIIITSTGKNITPSNIENLLKASRYIGQAVVIGEGRKYLTALVTLDRDEITRYAEKKGITYSDFSDLCKKHEILDLIDREIGERNKELARIEQIKKFTILDKEFQQSDEEVTPTLKVKRRIFEQKYKDRIEAMYTE